MTIVTIGRQNGSGGREIGRMLAEKLGVPCYDQEIVERTAEKCGTTVENIGKIEETSRTGSKLYFGGIPSPNPIFQQQAAAIRDLASEGPCVFVGRCADYVLRERKDVVNVFVTAPVPDRIKRSAARNGISEKEAYDRITEKDKGRAEYYMRYTGMTWGSVSNYHLSVNSGPIGVDGATELILTYIRLKDGKS